MSRLFLMCAAACLSACATISPNPVTSPAIAQSAVSSPLEQRIAALPAVLKGEIAPADYFDAAFLSAVPADQLDAIAKSIIAQNGQPLTVLTIDKKSSTSATITVAFEKAIGTFNINITDGSPGKVIGLLATNFAATGDSLEKIGADFKALPGNAGFVITALKDSGSNTVVAEYNAATQFGIGSTFKLYILAELASQIEAKERSWRDVTPLAHRSFSSAATDKWPKDTPVTLATLALQMISVSDNSATDTLLHLLGRTAVERKLAQIGHRAPDKMLPFLSTVEAFALKSPANTGLRNRYLAASEAQQRGIINTQQEKLGFGQVDSQAFAGGPVYIDTIEWFAAPYDIAELLNHMRRTRNDKMLEVMAVNPGLPAATAAKWGYVGYKGGSEPGVISMSYLLHSKSGHWFAVSGSWNDPANAVDDFKFNSMMTRLVQTIEK
jgi:Beta-lactamase enzyme family